MDWNDIRLVLAICRAGTLSGAATALGINYSTVFRRLGALERRMNVRLFDRQPSGCVMTEAGESVLRSAERMEEEADALARQLLGKDLALQGSVRLTAPEGVSLRLLMPLLVDFSRTHPQIRQELIISSSALSLSRREADIAVRATRRPPDAYIGRKVCPFRFTIYASAAYWEKRRRTSLEEQSWVVPDDQIDFFKPPLWRKKVRARPRIAFVSGSAIATLEATRQGLGVAPLPCFLGDAEAGLVRVVDPPEQLTLTLWVLIHPDLRQTARVQALVAVIYDGLSRHRAALMGERSASRRRTRK